MTEPDRVATNTPAAASVVINGLLVEVGAGDAEAFALLYRLTFPRVYGLCRRLLRDDTEAEDVTQEVYLEVWGKAARFDPARGSAVSWLYRIAHHRTVDRIRTTEASRRRDAHHLPDQHHHDDTQQRLDDAADRQRMAHAITQLTDRRRQALAYAFYSDHTHHQASAQLGIPLGTYKSRVRDALLALRLALTDPT